MPRATEMNDSNKLIKLLLVGPSMVGKTHYALQAALAGFNLFYLDGDVAGRALSSQPDAIKKRVFYLDARDEFQEGQYVPRFATLMKLLCFSPVVYWNDSKQRTYSPATADLNDPIWAIRLSRLGPKDVLVIDSLTSLSNSVMRERADEAGIDLTDIERAERSIYASARNQMSGFLTMIRAAKCHVILLAHVDEWEQRRKNPGQVKQQSKEDNMIIVGTRQVPMTVSKPFGAAIAKDFTDAGWLSINAMGDRIIDFTPSADREGGGALTGKGKVSDMSWTHICKLAGVTLPGPDAPCEMRAIEELTVEDMQAKVVESPKVITPSATPTKVKGSAFNFATVGKANQEEAK